MSSATEVTTTGLGNRRSRLPRPGKPSAMALGFAGIGTVANTIGNVQNGDSLIPAIGKGIVSTLLDDLVMAAAGPVAGGLYFAGQIGLAAAQVGIELGKDSTQSLATAMGGNRSNAVINSRNAVTMRQRGMAMINHNGDVTRSALGSEARTYFRNSMSGY